MPRACVRGSRTRAAEKSNVAEAAVVIRGIEDAIRERFMILKDFGGVTSLSTLHLSLSAGEMSGGKYITKNWTFSAVCDTSCTIKANRNTDDYYLVSEVRHGLNNAGLSTIRSCKDNTTKIGKYVCKNLKNLGWHS